MKSTTVRAIEKLTGDEVVIKCLPFGIAYDESIPLAEREIKVAKMLREL